MKKILLLIIFAFWFNIGVSQENNNEIIIKSLEYLDSKFHLNFEKGGEYILVFYDESYYIYDKFYNKSNSNILRAKICYELEKIDGNKYSFVLKWAGEIRGTFRYSLGRISKLKYYESVQ